MRVKTNNYLKIELHNKELIENDLLQNRKHHKERCLN